MPLVKEHDILSLSEENHFAAPSFFPFNMDFLRIIIEVAEEERSPVIILQGPEFIESFGDKLFTECCKTAASISKVPVALAVDHTFKTDENTISQLIHSISLGWGSVMLDGSLLPFEENVALTKRMAAISKAAGVNCTGSLGQVRRFFPQAMDYDGPFEEGFVPSEESLTNPIMAKKFVEETGVSVLGIAAGQYIRSLWDGEKPPLKKTARLDMKRISEIKAATHAHLLLMGSTHVNEDDLSEAAANGVNYIKVASVHALIWANEIRALLDADKKVMFPEDIQKKALQEVKESMRHSIRLFHANEQIKLWR